MSGTLAAADSKGKAGKKGGKIPMIAEFRDQSGDVLRSDGYGPYTDGESRKVKVYRGPSDYLQLELGTNREVCFTFMEELCASDECDLPEGLEAGVEKCTGVNLVILGEDGDRHGRASMVFGLGKNDGLETALLCFGWAGGACNTLGDELTVDHDGFHWTVSGLATRQGCLVDADGNPLGCWWFPFEMIWWPKE